MSKQTDLLNLTDAITVDSSNNVGIGTSSPSRVLHTSGDIVRFDNAGTSAILLIDTTNNEGFRIVTNKDSGAFSIEDMGTAASGAGSERMRIDSSGNLLVGRTSTSDTAVGGMIRSDGFVQSTRDGNIAADFNRNTSDGDIVRFSKNSSTVGSIGNASANSIYIYGNGSALANLAFGGSSLIYPTADNVSDVGASSHRFDDIYATNGSIQTSDRNEKQDIEALSDAEQRVAVACKGLLRKFRWIDAVAEKGDNARIHFGIIAQDLQDAFAAEGLDAGCYAMFTSNTWWETQTEVPAVEADEENGIEAKEAYTRTDTYETLEEAPEGATERTRLGVRYPELLAFIIGAM